MSRKTKRLQPESVRIWATETGAYWAAAKVHNGRVTNTIRGREASDVELAVELLWEML